MLPTKPGGATKPSDQQRLRPQGVALQARYTYTHPKRDEGSGHGGLPEVPSVMWSSYAFFSFPAFGVSKIVICFPYVWLSAPKMVMHVERLDWSA